METTDRADRREKGLGLYLQMFICHPTCVVVQQSWETPGMFVGVVGRGIRAENPPSRQRMQTNYFVVLSELTVHTVCQLVYDALMLNVFLRCSFFVE